MADLRLRLARLELPLPLEPLVYRALRTAGADQRHERLTVACEHYARVVSASLVAMCRRLSLRTPELSRAAAGLHRPSFGHWISVIRAARGALEDRRVGEVAALSSLLDGLSSPYAAHPALAALAETIKRTTRVEGRTVYDLLGALPAYRNAVQSTHRDAGAGVREANAPVLLEGLLAMTEVAPPTGACTVVVTSQLARDERGLHAELALMHGGGPVLETLSFERDVWDSLERGRAYLHRAPALFVPLAPLAAAESTQDGWTLGWLEARVHAPTFQYDAGVSGSFRARVGVDDLRDLFTAEADEAPSAVVPTLDPWRGLLAYDEDHAPVYFGREEETEEILARLRRDAAIVIAGASGSGKSSLMFAGVLPRVRTGIDASGGRPMIARLAPGSHPVRALRNALLAIDVGDGAQTIAWSRSVSTLIGEMPDRDGLIHLARGVRADGGRLVLVVDQLEEAATLAEPSERAAFLDVLVALANESLAVSATVMATVRADLLGELFEHDGLRALVQERLYPLGSLHRARLLRVITEPLRGRKITIEPGLAETIVRDVGEDAGTLALVSQVLATLWDERSRYGDRLTKVGYEAAGRVEGALERQASLAYSAVSDRSLIDRVLLQLAHRSEDGRFTRRRVLFSDLAAALGLSADKLRALVAPFVERRLFTSSRTDEPTSGDRGATLEVAHEALFVAWRHLDDLLRNETEVLTLGQELDAAARGWNAVGRRGELWTDASTRLRRAEELVAAGRMDVSPTERAFLVESRRRVQRRRGAERAVAIGLGILAIVAVVMWRRAVESRRAAEVSRRDAEQSALAERSARALAEQITLGEQAVRTAHKRGYEHGGLVSALRAAAPSFHAGAAIPSSVADSLIDVVTLVDSLPYRGHSRSAHLAAFSADGELIVTGSRDRTARVWLARDGRLLSTLSGHGEALSAVAFAADARTVLTASVDGTLRLWPTLGDGAARVYRGSAGRIRAARFLDGKRAISGDASGEVRVWDLEATTSVLLTKHGGRIYSIDVADGGATVATASEDGHVRIIRTSDASVTRDLVHPGPVYAAVFSPDGARVLTNCIDHRARAFDLRSEDPPLILDAGKVLVEAVAWSPNGALIASADDDGVVRVFDAKTGKTIRAARVHQGSVFDLAFTPDSEHFISASDDRTVRITPIRKATQSLILRGHDAAITALAVNAAAQQVVSAGYDETPRLWRFDTGALVAPLAGVPRPPPPSLRARLAGPGRPPTTRLLHLVAHESIVQGLEFAPDGRTLVTASGDGTARVWDATTGRLVATKDVGAALNGVAFSDAGDRVVLAGADGAVRVWSLADDHLTELGRRTGAVRSVAWRGENIATTGDDGALCVWTGKPGEPPRVIGAAVDRECRTVALSPDTTRVAVGCIDSTIRVFSVSSGAAIGAPVRAHSGWINTVAFSPNSSVVASGGDDQRFTLFRLPDGSQLGESDAHHDWVHSIRFSRDGGTLLTAGADRTARIFRVADLSQLASFESASRALAAVFSPNGETIAVGGEDGIAHVYPSDARAYFTIGCALLRELPEGQKVVDICR